MLIITKLLNLLTNVIPNTIRQLKGARQRSICTAHRTVSTWLQTIGTKSVLSSTSQMAKMFIDAKEVINLRLYDQSISLFIGLVIYSSHKVLKRIIWTFIVLAGLQNQCYRVTDYLLMHDALPSYRNGVLPLNRQVINYLTTFFAPDN